jgi:uncharacterized protein (DUF2147 family)
MRHHFSKITYLLLIQLITFVTVHAQQDNGDGCVGVWLTGSEEGQIQIFKQGDRYFGKIVWIKDPIDAKTGKPPIDSKNPDPAKRTQLIAGLVNLTNLKYEGKNQWDGGKIYDPQNGKVYDCKIKLVNANRLDVRGYIGVSFVGRTETWKRVK